MHPAVTKISSGVNSFLRRRARASLILSLAVGLTALHGTSAAAQNIQIAVLSGRPDMVSGGDALVQINAPAELPLSQLIVKRNGGDVTAAFHPSPDAHTLTGLVTGLKLGENSLQVFAGGKSDGNPSAQIVLKDYPISGPIFSGPHEQPFICQTQEFQLPDGTSLGPALFADCSVTPVVTYVYRSTQRSAPADQAPGSMKPLTNLSSLPQDVAWTTTTAGEKVPYIVRVETGTINRAIYQFALLHDPTKETAPGPLAPPKAWNKRLVYSFGGGCTQGWYRQGVTLGSATLVSDAMVAKGYAEASSTLNVAGNNCNDVLSAETMMMVKERFIKAYGKPEFTIGRGGGGASHQQLQIADGYPGLLDGILPSSTFPDLLETVQMLSDTQLLVNYYANSGDTLTKEQQRAIGGLGQWDDFTASASEALRINPTVYCPRQLPAELHFDPVANPSGARCDVFDHTVNIYGRDPATGFARRPIDNTGVQYGLAVLNAGLISVAQFLDLNQHIGGFDNDANFVRTRTVADPTVLRVAYQTGRVTFGGVGLAQIPIIDVRSYGDLSAGGTHVLKFNSLVLRERLQKANGSIANEVLIVTGSNGAAQADEFVLAKMDEWLANLAEDTTNDRKLDRIARAKPKDLTDFCYTRTGERIAEPQTFSGGQCNTLYPTFPPPRMVAGGPLSNDVLKCQLKPVDFDDYKVAFTDAEKSQLKSIFPGGVCDWNKPGVEQQPMTATWRVY